MTDEQISDILRFIRPAAQWALSNGHLTWLDETQTEPTEMEIADGWAQLVAAEEAAAAAEAEKEANIAKVPVLEAAVDDLIVAVVGA